MSVKIFEQAPPKPQLVNYYYDRQRGCIVNYTVNNRDEFIMANDRQMAQALEDTGLIDTWDDNGHSIYVTHFHEVDGINCMTAEPLHRFISNWDRNKWQEFITAYEVIKTKNANKQTV